MTKQVPTRNHAMLRQANWKRAWRVLLFSLFVGFCLFSPRPALAAKRLVVFQLANLRQWIDLSYQYSGSTTDNKVGSDRSSQEHEFEQVYHFGIDYAILSRRLANGTLEVDLGTDQAISRESSSRVRSDKDAGLGLEFLFDMVLFERRPYPVTLLASRIQQRINAPFAQNYTVINSNYGAGLAVRNDLFPFQLNYRSATSETSGLSVDRIQSSDELTFESILNWWDFSETHLRGRISSIETDFASASATDLSTDSYDLSGQNMLIWGELARKNTLSSRYQLRKDTGASEMRSVQWAEDLELQLGKGLSVGGGYDYNKNDTTQQTRVENKNRGWIEHRLYKSLTTRLDYSGSEVEYSNGTDQRFRGQGSLSYTKALPKNSSLSLNYSYSYGELDRNLSDQNMFVSLEPVVVDLANFATIFTQLIDVATVRVFTDESKTLPYVGATASSLGNYVQLFLPGAVPGDTVYVEYSHRVNNSIEYSTTTHSIGAALGLFEQRYRLYTSISLSDQELIAGSDEVSPMTQQTYFQLGFEGNLKPTSFSSRFIYLDTALSTDKILETTVSHLQEMGRNLLTLRLTDRYSIVRQKEGLLTDTAAETEKNNSLMLNVDYRKPLRRNSTLSLHGQMLDMRGERTQDELTIGGALEHRWYKFELVGSLDITWTLQDNSTTREDLLYLKLRRYF